MQNSKTFRVLVESEDGITIDVKVDCLLLVFVPEGVESLSLLKQGVSMTEVVGMAEWAKSVGLGSLLSGTRVRQGEGPVS